MKTKDQIIEELKFQLSESQFITEQCLPILIDSCKKHDKRSLALWDIERGNRFPKYNMLYGE